MRSTHIFGLFEKKYSIITFALVSNALFRLAFWVKISLNRYNKICVYYIDINISKMWTFCMYLLII